MIDELELEILNIAGIAVEDGAPVEEIMAVFLKMLTTFACMAGADPEHLAVIVALSMQAQLDEIEKDASVSIERH